MAMPNFRLFETQARWSVYAAACVTLGALALSYVVFKGFNAQERVIMFDGQAGQGKYRPPIVMGLSAVLALTAVTGFGLAYSSLGERRNQLQRWSWMGLLGNGLLFTVTILLFLSWQLLAQQVIR